MVELADNRRQHQVVAEDPSENETNYVERAEKTAEGREYVENVVNRPLILLVDGSLTEVVLCKDAVIVCVFNESLNVLDLVELQPFVLWHSKTKVVIVRDGDVLLYCDASL